MSLGAPPKENAGLESSLVVLEVPPKLKAGIGSSFFSDAAVPKLNAGFDSSFLFAAEPPKFREGEDLGAAVLVPEVPPKLNAGLASSFFSTVDVPGPEEAFVSVLFAILAPNVKGDFEPADDVCAALSKVLVVSPNPLLASLALAAPKLNAGFELLELPKFSVGLLVEL